MRARAGRSLRGTRSVHQVRNIRSRNISVCCAMTKLGIEKYKTQTTAFNRETFSEFIASLIVHINREHAGSLFVFVLDNVPFHHSVEIATLIENSGHRLLFLPPYSPFLNPIENLFSKSKQYVRQERVNNQKELFAAIERSFGVVSPIDSNGYYRHMLGFLSRCLSKEKIVDE
ncbi:Transposable element Tcb1 transposase [Cucumispora dikerogammari]|nr:Transposable element Tcb1 transposase [Cucumispora dikerogammari]